MGSETDPVMVVAGPKDRPNTGPNKPPGDKPDGVKVKPGTG